MSVAIERAGSNELWPQVLQAMSRGVLSKVIFESRRISAFKTVSKHLILRFFLVICVQVVHCSRTTWLYKCTVDPQGHERVVHDQLSYRASRRGIDCYELHLNFIGWSFF